MRSQPLALGSVALAGTGLVLVASPSPGLRLAGAALSAAGAVAVVIQGLRFRQPPTGTPLVSPDAETFAHNTSADTAQTEAAPGSDQPVVPALPPDLGPQVQALTEHRTVARVAGQEVAALLTDVETNAAELLRAATSVRTLMEQLEASVGTIAAGNRDQSDRLGAASAHAAESAASVTEIAREAAALASGVRETAAAARSGADLLGEAGSAVTGLGAVVGESTTAMERLAALSSQIGALVEGIGGLAKQSNLLALNAAIEAARAGANGRSFGVVADAMREMATQASAAATEAGRLVAQVQTETQAAAAAVRSGGQQVAASTQLMERVVTDLRAILERTAGLEGGMVSISEHAVVAEEAALKLAGQIGAVSAVSAQATAEAERMADSSREASTSIKAIAHVSRHYAKMPAQVRNSLVPVERAVAEAGDLAERLREAAPAETQPQASGTVRYADWQPWENCRRWWHLDRFLAAHPGVNIQHLHLSNADFDGQLALPETPDVTWAAPDWAPQLLQPIDDLIERDGFDLSAFVPGVIDAVRKLGGGRLYGLPMHINMPLMVYNRNLFDRAGVPHPRPGISWEELLPQLRQIRQRTGAHGVELDMRNQHFLPFVLHFLAPTGAPLMDEAGSQVLGGRQVEQQLQFLYDLSRQDLLLPYDQLWAPVRPFVKGEVAVLIGSTATLLFTPIREMAARGELNFVPEVTAHPRFAGQRSTAATNFHLIGLHKFARNREACWALLQHLITDPERIRGDILRWGQAPVQWNETVRAAYAELGRQGAPTKYHELWEAPTAPMPPYILTPGFRRLETVAGHEMALLLAGQKSPADLLRTLQTALDRQ